MKVHIIAFPDASFGTLRNHGSVEGYCAFLATPLKRDGAVLCKGNLLVFYGKKISRVSRPTAHTEGIALRNASDATLYLQCLMGELLSGKFRTSFSRKSEDVTPIISPPRASSSYGESSSESTSEITYLCHKTMRQSDTWTNSTLVLSCAKRGGSSEAGCSDLVSILESALFPPDRLDLGRPAIYALLVCDCANAIALMSRLNPNPIEKVYRLIMCLFV